MYPFLQAKALEVEGAALAGLLSAHRFPAHLATSREEIDNPRPVPPYCRVWLSYRIG